MSPDTLHSIKDQFCIRFMINHISFTSIPHIPISGTQQHLPILLLPLFPKLWILATVFPLFSLHLCFKKNQGLFYILACLIYLWFLSTPLFPFGFNFAFSYIKFSYFTATFPSIKISCIYLKKTEKSFPSYFPHQHSFSLRIGSLYFAFQYFSQSFGICTIHTSFRIIPSCIIATLQKKSHHFNQFMDSSTPSTVVEWFCSFHHFPSHFTSFYRNLLHFGIQLPN